MDMAKKAIASYTGKSLDDTDDYGRFLDRFGYAKQAKARYHKRWNENIRLYQGIHYDEKRPKWKPSSVENMCYSLIESQIPLMTDSMMTISVEAQTKDDYEAAESLKNVFASVWQTIGMDETMAEAVKDFLLFGNFCLHVFWDADKYNGMGEIGVMNVDLFDIFVSPNATSDRDIDWLIHRRRMPIWRVRKSYPEKGHLVVSDGDFDNDEVQKEIDSNQDKRNRDYATVYTEWSYDEETARPWITTWSNGVQLEKRESPHEHEGFPYIFSFNSRIPGEFFAMGELENLKALQYELNTLRSQVVQNATAMSNVVWIVDTNSGVKEGSITSKPGQVISKNPGTELRRETPPPLPGYIQAQIENIKQSMQDVAGIHEINRGVAPSGIPSAAALDILSNKAETRIRGKLRQVEMAIEKLGKWWLALVRQNYSEPRLIKVSGSDKTYKFVTFDATKLRQEETIQDPQTGEQKVIVYLTDFDVHVVTGSSMAINKSSKFQQALEMFRAGSIDVMTLIEISEIGDPELIRRRMIEQGMLKDPNAPTAEYDNFIKAMSDKVKFTVTSTDPNTVKEALDELVNAAQQQQQLSDQQKANGYPDAPPTQEGQVPDPTQGVSMQMQPPLPGQA